MPFLCNSLNVLSQLKVLNNECNIYNNGVHHISLYVTEDYLNVTVHRTDHDGTLKELLRTNGGPWGESSVETVITMWLTDVFGKYTINKLKDERCDDYRELIQNIISKKQHLSYNKTKKERFLIGNLLQYMQIIASSLDLTWHLEGMKLKDDAYINCGKLCVPAQVVRSWFDEPINKGIRHISAVLAMPAMNDVDTILLVGEFAECPLVQETIKEAFRNKRIVIPREPRDAVMKGAVLIGHQSYQ